MGIGKSIVGVKKNKKNFYVAAGIPTVVNFEATVKAGAPIGKLPAGGKIITTYQTKGWHRGSANR